MKLLKASLLLWMILLSSLVHADTAAGQDPTTVIVDHNQSGFTVRLKANPTTGYSWFLQQYDNTLVTVQDHQYQAPTSQLVGAGGVDVWHFKLTPQAQLGPVTTQIHFVYARPWEIQQGSETVITVVVQ